MKATKLKFYTITTLTIILGKLTTILPAYSQPITPANDGTGTTVNQNGNQLNIQGGTRNGANLFHSFDQFNVNTNQTANFLTTSDTQNILGRVTGGNASIINGLIQVIGGNSNLFLMNPAGIMFGRNASLNIPASFSVTTATGIGFNNNNFWFKAMGTNDYSTLVGTPSGYSFNQSNSGAIVNQGNLSLNPGENLTLLGGTVINTGQLSSPGGNITIAAVEGSNTLRISQPGQLLSLEINSKKANKEDISQIHPLLLPNLLTGGDNKHATSIKVNADGNLVLTDNVTIANTSGDTIVSGNIDVSTSENIGGQVNVFGDRVALINANINADGVNGGGTVLIGGDFQGNSIVPNSQETFVNQNSFISADAITNGDGGKVIVWSDGITNFDGNISATGGENYGDGGFVEVSGKQQLNFHGQVNVSAEFGNTGTILLDPENIILGGAESNTSLENLEGNIVLEADNDITINENIEADSSVQLQAGRSININADINTSSGNGDINLFGNNQLINSPNRSDGAASINQSNGTTLNAGSGNINIQLGNAGEVGDINLANLTTTGQVLVNANGGNIGRVSDNSLITAGSGLFLTFDSGEIGASDRPLRLDVASVEGVAGNGGAFFESLESVNIGGVSEEVNGISTIAGGDIVLSIEGDVVATEDIFTDVSGSELGGDINIRANNLSVINGAQISASTFGNGDAGNVDITVSSTVIFDGVSADGLFPSGAVSIVGEEAAGNGGDLTITTNSLQVINGAQIFSTTRGEGSAGDIYIETDSQLIIGENSEISAFTESTADGGNIIISYPETINFQGDGEITVGSTGGGQPGNIITEINPTPDDPEQPIPPDESPSPVPSPDDSSPPPPDDPEPTPPDDSPSPVPDQTPPTLPDDPEQPIPPDDSPSPVPDQTPPPLPNAPEQPIPPDNTPSPVPGDSSPTPPNDNNQRNSGETNTPSTPSSSDVISIATPSNNNQTTNTQTAKEKIEELKLSNITSSSQINNDSNFITLGTTEETLNFFEGSRTNEYSNYFGRDFNEELINTTNIREVLGSIANKTGTESAIIYVQAYAEQLQLILYIKNSEPIVKIISDVQRKNLINAVLRLRAEITNPARRHTDSYLPAAQKLYNWMIAPISAELETAKINTLLFSMDQGLRSLPIAALHDGEQFLIEKYSLSLIPSISLTDIQYRPIQGSRVLAMGASKFITQSSLPAVPVELETISQKLWQGSKFLNQEFTRNNLFTARKKYPYPIIHLATHAEFRPGLASNSYIQLWGSEQIKLDQIRELGWNEPQVELLVLSACKTAFGDKNAELGFAGLALAAGVKSALASIWYVSDEGTLGLMTEFYSYLNNVKIKAEALRLAQLRMLRGEVVMEDGELRGSEAYGAVALPSVLRNLGSQDFSHPYYWAGFTMIGSPW
ncbi:MAG: CHAT domain-containing protein [Trichodesmium sp.]